MYAGQGQTFSESYDMTYDSLKRISEIEYGSSSKTLTFNYDSGVGKLTSIDDSEEDDSFDYAYDSKERLSSITLPNTQGTISYTYDDTSSGKGRLDEITYPNDRSIDFTWDSRGRVIQLDMDDDGTVTTYYLSYNDLGKIKQIQKSEDSMTIYTWYYVYGLYGAEKATVKDSSNDTILTQNYTTDPSGRILSMTYTPTQGFGGSFTGELYFHYDNYGNTMLLTDSEGTPKASYEYDLHTGETINEWNVLGIINPFTYGGAQQEITIPEPWTGGGIVVVDSGSLSANDNGNSTVITDDNVMGGMTKGSKWGMIGACGATTPEEKFDKCMERCYGRGKSGEGYQRDIDILNEYFKIKQTILDYKNEILGCKITAAFFISHSYFFEDPNKPSKDKTSLKEWEHIKKVILPELEKQLKKWEDTEKAYVGLFPWLSDASGVKNKINNCFSICNAESGLDREPGWKKGSYFVIVG